MCSGVEVILTSGVNYRPYRPTIAALLGHEPEYVNVYMASEGMLGYESPEARDEFELFAGEMVFGFVPHEQYLEGDYSRRLRLDQLSAGVDYALLLTNGSGAFNYAIGDILTCTKSDGVPRFKLAGRMVLTLDVVAEKTSISAVG